MHCCSLSTHPWRVSMRRVWLFAVAAILLGPATAGRAEPPPGATSCSGCHALNPALATAIPRLTGRSAAELAGQMQAFKSGQRPSTVMGRIAKGFSEPEIEAIAQWYAAQK
jgi:cytochrome subunit of sulfide dehydrogenase